MLEWLSESEGRLGGVPFLYENQKFDKVTTPKGIVVLKPKGYFDMYAEQLPTPRNILEIGFFEGGSTMILAEMFPGAKIVGVDLRPPNQAVMDHMTRLGYGERVRLFYRTAQDNRKALDAILAEHMPSPDLIIDDASHRYEYAKASFDITFPRLVAGGHYVVEDWAWAHWRGYAGYQNVLPLSNLTFELTMATAFGDGRIVDRVSVSSGMTIARMAMNCPPLDQAFTLSNRYHPALPPLLGPKTW